MYILENTMQLSIYHNFVLIRIFFDRTKYLIMLKSNVSGFYTHNCTQIKINSDEDLPIGKNNHA